MELVVSTNLVDGAVEHLAKRFDDELSPKRKYSIVVQFSDAHDNNRVVENARYPCKIFYENGGLGWHSQFSTLKRPCERFNEHSPLSLARLAVIQYAASSTLNLNKY